VLRKKIGSVIKSATSKILWILVGLILGVALSSPIKSLLMHIPAFYFLDDYPPEIESMLPDIRINKLVDEPLPKINVRIRDKGSGLNIAQCSAELWGHEDEQPSTIECAVSKSDSVFEIAPIDSIATGEYTLKITFIDKAKNNLTCSFPFVLLTEDLILIGAGRRKWEDREKTRIFSDFFEVQKENPHLLDYDLYLLEIMLHNTTKGGYLRDIYLLLDVGNIVMSCKLVEGFDAVEFEAYNFSQSCDRTIPQFQVFSSQWVLRIGEIAPTGVIRMKMLVGLYKSPIRPHYLVNNLDINGFYIFDGYGFQVPQELHKTIPIQF